MKLAEKIERARRVLRRLLKEDARCRERATLKRFPVGTEVRLTCDCSGETAKKEHEGTWIVGRFDVDAGDFRLTRGTDEVAYATPGSMRRVP